jgi:hypothetical protein
MGLLTQQQRDRAVEVMREYLAAPRNPDGRTPQVVQRERDERRTQLIESELKPLVQGYLQGHVALSAFKSQIDGLNKRHEYWGFKGIKGQMFFNMLVNSAGDEKECDHELRKALAAPASEEVAKNVIRTFASYATRLGDQHVKEGGSKHGRPKVGSVPFFLSYFWQLQDQLTWPVFYTNSVNTLSDLNLWQPKGALAEDYIEYKQIHEELWRLFTEASGQPFGLYEVEHVFWFKGGNPYGEDTPLQKGRAKEPGVPAHGPSLVVIGSRLPESYVPPIVAVLSSMARNEPLLQEAAKKSGTSLERAFEKSIDAAFTILGYDTKLLGQGQGRVPDGLATAPDDYYAILWDAKVREKVYSMGTDDRAIREYVTSQSRDLRRNRSLRNIYYVIVSSSFADDFDDAVRSIKMETEVNEVVLLEAEALVAIVDARLRNPRELTLGPDGIQRLFSSSGRLSPSDVRELLG